MVVGSKRSPDNGRTNRNNRRGLLIGANKDCLFGTVARPPSIAASSSTLHRGQSAGQSYPSMSRGLVEL